MSTEEISNDYPIAQTIASASRDYSSEQQDIAFAAMALRTSALTERQLAQAMSQWTIHGSLPLNEHLCASGLIDVDTNNRLMEKCREFLEDVCPSQSVDPSASVVAQTLEAIDPSGTVARLMGIRAVAGAGVTDATGERKSTARYRLLRKLGQGGLGRVWLAFDEQLKRPVAVKELTARNQAAALERFRREAEITGRLEHPGIVPIYQLGDDATTGAFYVMRFLGKQTLHDSLMEYHERLGDGDKNPMLLRSLLTDFVSVCQAIGHAHSRKVIHRDLKPENVAIDSFGQVIVIDWGLAKVLDEIHSLDSLTARQSSAVSEQSTMQGQVLGTPLYMAPEQASGRIDELDERTDIYGLGAILYAILTGCAPHEQTRESSNSTTGRELLSAIAGRPSPRAIDACSHVDPALSAICEKAMAPRQYARYQSATELAEEVQHWMAGERIAAYQERPAQRLSRWIQHHRIASQAIALTLVTAVVALAVFIAASIQAGHANRRIRFDQMRGYERELLGLLHSTTSQVSKDARFMSSLPPIQAIIHAQNDNAEGESEEVWRTRLEQIYEEFLRANPDYLSIAYLKLSDEALTDIVRVERAIGDRAYLRRVPVSRLNSFSDPEMIARLRKLDRGDIRLVIRGAHEREDDRVEQGVRLFAVTPAYDDTTGELYGLAVVELDLLSRLVDFLKRTDQATSIIHVTDREGAVWVTDNPAEGVAATTKAEKIALHLPEAAAFFDDPESEQQTDQDNGWIASRTALDPYNPETGVGLVLQLLED
ncbi:serine/threonine-protein kinase [Lignipirellula cremea]|uniref:Serine/threonine-protein kinase PknD n=1 Tax=Lignipirellula cremea TaxID=2528010 RepID=A0A518E4F8_9BACT|nr:serine/threonine-protein kinase [Lignipirellula cremea]QDU98979.1 Serine/threonine-protein kinase PknD [Lignipirellula cremea]